ncbi:hypothetical protein DSO57_1007686 [Entomophthora muscae]|uniref:Uncharacterized protein n=1 Tax=Entomophthora muscae TaxID=34485 RepID=A0ACC2U6B3_9FUNG|nr:hypothetical protein DSO57_1007686 [Entomophthora muscae]
MSEEIGPTLTSNPGKPKSLLDFLSETPYTAWVTSASLLTSYPWATSRGIVKLPGMPTRGSAITFSILFAGTGALSASGDIINSTGIATASSLSYLLLNFGNAISTRPRYPIPLGLACTVTVQGVIYGQRYFREYFRLI